jgi:hypothetical protein
VVQTADAVNEPRQTNSQQRQAVELGVQIRNDTIGSQLNISLTVSPVKDFDGRIKRWRTGDRIERAGFAPGC